MLENITKRLDKLFKKIRGRGLLTEENIDETLREVRLALLESDVHFKVAKNFCEAVRKKAVGKAVLESLTPGQQVVKIVSEELTELMGGQSKGLALAALPPTVVMLVGLQGSGKTTTAGKLALFFKKKDKRVLLVAADLQRPAAVDQLQTLGKSIEVSVVSPDSETSPVAAAEKGIEYGRVHGFDVVILDTAG
ncbi:MAG: signal recognition particle receptor subunit alpha, partial [Nitrospirota bacterium]|nr:signal recognition particle receptor subunit alpha [Nitrospirota bacterium]